MEAANSKMVYESEDIAFNRLEVCNYRHLQGLAKQMNLPSNVKKVELIEMIRAKRYCSEKDLEAVINRVKMERRANAQIKKNQKKKNLRMQGTEVSSTSQSPPITLTPVRPRHSDYVIQYSSKSPINIMKNNPRPSVVEAGAPFLQKLKSDRVLRSFNSMRRPNYRVLDQTDCVVGVVKSRNTIKEIRSQERIQHFQEIRHQERIQQFQEIHHKRAFQSVNVNVQTQRPIVNALVRKGDRQLVPVVTRSLRAGPGKRQRKVSGIYPLECQENPPYQDMPTVNFRQTDGRICKINAVIQRPLANTLLPKNHTFQQKRSVIRRDSSANLNPCPKVTIQDVINYKVDHPTVDLTHPEANESKVHEIDNSNGIDRPCYEHRNVNNQPNNVHEIDLSNGMDEPYYEHVFENNPHNKVHRIDNSNGMERPSYEQRNMNNQQIELVCKSRQIDQPMRDYQTNYSRQYDQNNANAIKLSYQGRTLVNIVPEKTSERDQNIQVYKKHQTTSNARKGWRIEFDQGPKAKKAKAKVDVNNQSLNTTDGSTSQCFTHRAKEYRNQVPAVPKIISAPMSREPRYDQEIRDRNMDHARKMEYARNAEHARNVEYASNAEHDRNVEYARNAEHAGNVDHSRNMDYTSAEMNDYVFSRHVEYTRNSDVRSCSQLARIANKNHARNMEHARNTGLKAIEPARNETDLRNQYPNMSSLTDVLPNEDYSQHTDVASLPNVASHYSVYYHKRINAEQVTSSTVERLPRINEVFSQFNEEAYKKYAQPLLVKVSGESERAPMPMTINVNNACLLESIFNFKSQFLTNPPLCRIPPPLTNCPFSIKTNCPFSTETNCTFSTETVPTAVEQSTAAQNNNHHNPYERASAYQLYNESYQTRYEHGQPDVGCAEDMISPSATIDTQESQPSPEMVEDALELISQDGDYMERIGMDVRVQCILCCEWAGPRFIMEYHLKNEHPLEIHHVSSPTSRLQISLARSLNGRTWSSQLLQYRDTLYALSALRDETSLLLAFSAIPNDLVIPRRCRITVCNERLKQTFFHECEIKHVPESMPYEYGQECLVLDFASLDVMPDSDNKLVNRDLDESTGIIGQSDLDSVQLAVNIQLFD